MDELEEKIAEQHENLASELLHEVKAVIKLQWILIAILVVLLAATNIYHIYQWSQFDTVVVDSGAGDGNANYVGGDNAGGIFNGESSSAETQEIQQEEIKGDQN